MTTLNKIDQEIVTLIRANQPIINIVTHEEERFLSQLKAIRDEVIEKDKQHLDKADVEKWKNQGRSLVTWSCIKGLVPSQTQIFQVPAASDSADPYTALRWVHDQIPKNQWGGLFVFFDVHPFVDMRYSSASAYMTPSGASMPPVQVEKHLLIRRLRDIAELLRQKRNRQALILVSPVPILPFELEKDIVLVDYPLPSEAELQTVLQEFQQNRDAEITLNEDEKLELARKTLGLTLNEAEDVWQKAVSRDGRLGPESINLVSEEKKSIIQKSNVLEFYATEESFKTVGGLENLKEWVRRRKIAFSGEQPNKRKLPTLKGILLVGIPGCGKSLSAKAVAAELRVPLIRLDVGKLYDSLVGSSEANLRRAIKVVNSLAPVVLWIDEIEKGFPKSSGVGDSGVSQRILATFLNWMQDKTQLVFVVATANDFERMPSELTRKGRFDEVFYVGLPSPKERRKIFEIHLDAWDLKLEPNVIDTLVEKSNYFTGAEIEQSIRNSLWRVSGHTNAADIVLEEVERIRPLSKRKDDVGGLINDQDKAKQVALLASEEAPTEIEKVDDTPPTWRIGVPKPEAEGEEQEG
jgi:SpoVK/Ycf46/Vps4 family AAA+-type ATPase